MERADTADKKLDEQCIAVRRKISALWTSLMFCFVYADILGLYDPWLIGEILKGTMGPLGPITQELKLAIGVLMSLPAVMIFLSLVLKAGANRWANIGVAGLFTVVTIITLLMDPWAYYIYFGLIEIALTLTIVWYAWTWPRRQRGSALATPASAA